MASIYIDDMCVYTYTYRYVCIYVYVYMHIHTYACVYIYMTNFCNSRWINLKLGMGNFRWNEI